MLNPLFMGPLRRDPYQLFVSCSRTRAYGSIILMSQNRQDEKDRSAQIWIPVNLKTAFAGGRLRRLDVLESERLRSCSSTERADRDGAAPPDGTRVRQTLSRPGGDHTTEDPFACTDARPLQWQ